jgi:glutamine amidotransferase
MTIAIVDYGVGNLGSIKNMLTKLGAASLITADASEIVSASKLILPGVGSFDSGMDNLNNSGLRTALDVAVLQRRIPTLGICLGMQMMTFGSEEGSSPGLGWIPANTVRFAPSQNEIMKVPHMGWRTINKVKESKIIDLLDDDARFYFVHSYHVQCQDAKDILFSAQYGSVEFDAAFERENILGFQFHPEKSHRFGMSLFKAFLERY